MAPEPTTRDLLAASAAATAAAASGADKAKGPTTLAEATERFCQDVLLPFARRLPPDQLRPLLMKERVQVLLPLARSLARSFPP